VAPISQHGASIPQAEGIFSTQLRQAFEEDGRVTLVNSSEAADVTLSVVITDYHRETVAVRETDTGLANKLALILTATCSLHDNRSGKMLFADRVVSVQRRAFTDNGIPSTTGAGDQLQSEYNTMPLLAESLAGRLAHTVLDVW
jgi:Lipopolysaccharide-assembly